MSVVRKRKIQSVPSLHTQSCEPSDPGELVGYVVASTTTAGRCCPSYPAQAIGDTCCISSMYKELEKIQKEVRLS
jgi:hypothetical protein